MKTVTAAGLILFISAQMVNAAEGDLQLPPMRYVSSLEDSMFDSLKDQSIFSQLDKELYGSPLVLAVTHTFSPTAGDAALGLTSVLLSSGTLGLTPIVSNNDLIVTYTLNSHGRSVASFSYSKNFTQATSVYSTQGFTKLDKSAMTWARSTVEQFVTEIAGSKEVHALTDEYNFYFGDAKR